MTNNKIELLKLFKGVLNSGDLMNELISVIVPIYNIEKYLSRCITSIIEQTYKNLEIILIDDGSSDSCYQICDNFSTSDDRIRVIHQKNSGLSEARNSGINLARGAFILLVDGDDYIEPNMVDMLYQAIIEYDADAVCCGHYKEYVNKSIAHPLTKEVKCYEGDEIVVSAMKGSVFGHYAWEKLWKADLFNCCRFPSGMQFEDVATTWKLFLKCNRVVTVPDVLYHYIYRRGSIGNTKTMKNLTDRWIAFKERYDVMAEKNDELRLICTEGCLQTIGYTWRWLHIVKDRDKEKIHEMRKFLYNNKSYIGGCSLATRVSLFCALHSNPITIAGCYYINQIYRRFNGLDKMS